MASLIQSLAAFKTFADYGVSGSENTDMCAFKSGLEMTFFTFYFFFRKAFQLYYKEFVEFSLPTEDIYLE